MSLSLPTITERNLTDIVSVSVGHIRVLQSDGSSKKIPIADLRLADNQITNGSTVAGSMVRDALNTLKGGIDTLGTNKENASNKKTTLTDSDTDYPTTRAVNTGLALKTDKTTFEDTIGDIEAALDAIILIQNEILGV